MRNLKVSSNSLPFLRPKINAALVTLINKKNFRLIFILDHSSVTETAPMMIGEMSKLELLRSRLKSDVPLHDLESLNDTATLARNVCTVMDQIKHLRAAIENTIEKSKREKTNGSYECEFGRFKKYGSYFIFLLLKS